MLILFAISTQQAKAESVNITTSDALAITRNLFQGRDVDYYLINDMNLTQWSIFVDAEPMKGWLHEAHIVKINKTSNKPVASTRPASIFQVNIPPSGNLTPLDVKNRNGANPNYRPYVAKSSQSNSALSIAERTFAVIISGGICPTSNHQRYWNDCSFIYQTLVNKYGIPKNNIYPIMSDGDNPGADMNYGPYRYKSQPLDLDNDGLPDIQLAATVANIEGVLNSLSKKMKEDDHLFIYVIDHGGTNDNYTDSFICLWNYETLSDAALASMLTPFTEKYVNVNVVLGQCFAGGFNDNLTKVGCVVASACRGDENSFACPDGYPFDEFVYQWTCAINGADPDNIPVNADNDTNGRISMEEAFSYANINDRREEHPQFVSTPLSVGEDLAFNYLAPAVDLYIQDNEEDTGKEPNLTTDKFWLSPSIWIRNKDDGIYEHENPYYSQDHTSVTIYVRVHNRGKKDYVKGKYYVHAYWAKASTGFQPDAWMGNELYKNGEVTGGPMTPSSIPNIPAGEYRDVKITWALPAELLSANEKDDKDKHHFCILAKILDTHLEPWYTGAFNYNCKSSNKDAQKNVSIINKNDMSEFTDVFIRNIYNKEHNYTLELIPRTPLDEAIYKFAKIEMKMSTPIYNSWQNGGFGSTEINRPASGDPKIVQFKSKNSRIEGLAMANKEFDKVGLRFSLYNYPLTGGEYTLDLIQKNESGTIIGGETFVLTIPKVTGVIPPVIGIDPIIKPNGQVQLITDSNSDTSSIRWENCDGITIGEGPSIIVNPTYKTNNTYYVYALTEEGLSSADITLEPEMGFDNIEVINNMLTLTLLNEAEKEDRIIITFLTTGNIVAIKEFQNCEKEMRIEVSSFESGIYTVSYIKDGMTVDSTKIVIP